MLRAAGRDGAADPDAAAEEEPPDDASSTPLAAAPAALPLQTAAALEVAASDHTGIFGLIDAFEQVADVVRETVVAESAQQSEQYSRVLGGVRRQDAPDAAEHQAAAGQARQAQPDAAAHQAAASRKAAEKRSATAMSEEERRAKDAARKREVRAAAAAKEERRRRRREAKAAEAVEAAAAEAAEEAAAEAAAEEEEAKQEREAAMFEAVNAAVVAAGEAEIDSFEFEEFLFHLDRVRYLVDDHELIDEFRMWRQEDTANNQTRRACEEAEAAEEWTADGDEAPQQMNSMPYSWLVEAVRQGVVDEPGWQKWWRPPAHLTAHGYEYEYDAFIPEENEACEPTHGECCGGGGGGRRRNRASRAPSPCSTGRRRRRATNANARPARHLAASSTWARWATSASRTTVPRGTRRSRAPRSAATRSRCRTRSSTSSPVASATTTTVAPPSVSG